MEKKQFRKILVCCVTELLLLLGNIVTAPARIVKLLSLYVCIRVRPRFFDQVGHETMYTTPIAELLCVKNGRAIVVCGSLTK